ncbi:metalloregulator ArsR/SmtB family transcription factor [Methanothermobacter sp.]|uniref:ArsR/SmtB family transcription factor n=1 Tax=Methanothermobacter sp. TaxID=1884223 RepID=UPI0026187D71|nr:metalloregulator ArsR/SmtB family transcription factor [Methanothermobacter sp.]MDI9614303.1 metalloregulator ArsR/SmtB family transcription factor [Methanothermobacter sp.]
MMTCSADKPSPEQLERLKERLERLPDDDKIERDVNAIKALADPTRLKIIHLLSDGELCVCEIMAALEKPQPTVSHHLNILKRAGFLKSKKIGVWVHYMLSDDSLPSKVEYLLNDLEY